MSDFEYMRETYGSDDPDDWIDQIYWSNVRGLVRSAYLGIELNAEELEDLAEILEEEGYANVAQAYEDLIGED